MGGDSLIGQIGVVLGTIIGIIVILYLAYVSTKFIGKRYTVRSGGGKKIKVIDSVSVGKESSVMLVKAGGKVLLVGVASGNINLISEMDESEFDEEEENTAASGMDFKTAFKNVLENKIGRKNKDGKENENDSSQEK